MWRSRTEAGSVLAALFQNSVLSMTHSFRVEQQRGAMLQRIHRRREQVRDLGIAGAARRELECVQLLGSRVARIGFSFHTWAKIRAGAQ